jgi:protein-L-isoaspartate O-methyltransferase
MQSLASRHLADLRVAEVARALRALSSTYVERRHKVASGSTLDSAGKRAAFALYYGPLHFIAARHVVRQLAVDPPPHLLDLGCGTGAVGAAWALAGNGSSTVTGIDRHPWAVEEARRTYHDLNVDGSARIGDVARVGTPRPKSARLGGVIAAYLLNELPEPARLRLEDQMVAHAGQRGRVLVIEPIARGIAPWWDTTAARLAAVGGRADEWRVRAEVPELVATLGKAAGLDYRELRFRTIVV